MINDLNIDFLLQEMNKFEMFFTYDTMKIQFFYPPPNLINAVSSVHL